MWVLGFSEAKRLYVEDGGIKKSQLRGVGLSCDRLLASLPKLPFSLVPIRFRRTRPVHFSGIFCSSRRGS